jgi:outer membrane protein assembly factor BamD
MKVRQLFLSGLILLTAVACSKYQKVLKSNDYELKYVKAKEYYNKNDYFRALPLFEELVNVFKGTDRAENLYYYYAYCHFGLGDYMTAMYHFKNYASTFKNSEHEEECQYMYAYCFYIWFCIPSLCMHTVFVYAFAYLQYVCIFY